MVCFIVEGTADKMFANISWSLFPTNPNLAILAASVVAAVAAAPAAGPAVGAVTGRSVVRATL